MMTTAPPPARCAECGSPATLDRGGLVMWHTLHGQHHHTTDTCPGSMRPPLLPGLAPRRERR